MIFARLFIFSICLLPFLLTVYGAFTGQLGVNPVETIIRNMGDWALYFLFITLAATPVYKLFKWPVLLRYRRMLGLYCFFYACVHFLSYVWFEQFFNLSEILADIIKRPFISMGFISLLLLLPLAVTSNRYMMRRLGKNWSRLHKLIYPISVLLLIHYFWMIKADYQQPLIFTLVLILLLGFRLLIYQKK